VPSAKNLGVSADQADAAPVLFSLQTYFSLAAKLVSLVILQGATGVVLIKELSGTV
jgi:hypothetical protein